MKITMDSSSSLPLLVWATIILFLHLPICKAWNNEEMEMYDLVEELGKNFYEVLGVAQDANDKEIRQAYRKLSIKLHPDKNPAEDAATQFRQLVGIYEVLKNKELRESYNKVLVEGLPNWKQPMFYFRRARKFAVWQVGLILLVIVSITQYAASWGSYFEKRLSMKEMVDARLRKTHRTKKGQKEGPTAEELEAEFEKYLPKPTVYNTAPFQLCRGVKYLIFSFPKDLLAYREELRLQKEEEERELAIEAERLEQERLKAEEPKKPRKRKVFKVPEKTEQENDETQPIWNVDESAAVQAQQQKPAKKQVISGGLWTDDDIAELSKLCSKFPGGTPNRWETISEILNRPVPEVTFMAKKVLEKLANKAVEEEEESVPQVKIKVKTKGGKADGIASVDNKTVENWSAEEQKQLEYALQVYPKGSIERWEKIAHMVPNRSKEECMQRFKYVADMIKKKKEAKPEPEESSETKSENDAQSEVKVEEEKKEESHSLEVPQSSSTVNPSPNTAQSTPAPTISETTTPVQVPNVQSTTTISNSGGSGSSSSSKSKKKTKSKTATGTVNKNSDTEGPQKEKNEEVNKPSIVPDSKPEIKKLKTSSSRSPPKATSSSAGPPPPAARLVESEIDSVANQLQMLVDESDGNEQSKTRLRRSSSSKSSTEDDAVIVIARGSKESSVERKNSISSNNSDNEWCVVEDSGSVTISSINTH